MEAHPPRLPGNPDGAGLRHSPEDGFLAGTPVFPGPTSRTLRFGCSMIPSWEPSTGPVAVRHGLPGQRLSRLRVSLGVGSRGAGNRGPPVARDARQGGPVETGARCRGPRHHQGDGRRRDGARGRGGDPRPGFRNRWSPGQDATGLARCDFRGRPRRLEREFQRPRTRSARPTWNSSSPAGKFRSLRTYSLQASTR